MNIFVYDKKLNSFNGFIIKIHISGYGKNYQFEPEVIYSDNDYFLLSHYNSKNTKYILIKIDLSQEKKYVILLESKIDSNNKFDEIYDYLVKNKIVITREVGNNDS